MLYSTLYNMAYLCNSLCNKLINIDYNYIGVVYLDLFYIDTMIDYVSELYIFEHFVMLAI